MRVAGTEKTKWRSAVQAGGQASADKLKLCGSKGQTTQEATGEYTQGIFVTDELNYTQWAPAMHPCSSNNHSASISNLKTNPLYKAKRSDKNKNQMQLTIHGVVAGRGLLAEAAAHGAALSPGHKVLPAGETVVAGKVALWGMA